MIYDHNQVVLHEILEKAAAGIDRGANEQKIGDFYAACMNTEAIDKAGLKPLQPELDRIAALKSKDELPELLAHFQLINVNAFLGFGEQQDFKDARKQIAAVGRGRPGTAGAGFLFPNRRGRGKNSPAICAAHHQCDETHG